MSTQPTEVIPTDEIVDKRGLCKTLGWSRPTLDKRLREDPHFPILRVGEGRGVPWQFHAPTVVAYVEHGTLTRAEPAARAVVSPAPAAVHADAAPDEGTVLDAAPPKPAAPTSGRIVHAGEYTAKQRLTEADAALKEDKLRRERAELVEAEKVLQVMTTTMAHMGSALDGLVDGCAKRAGLDNQQTAILRDMVLDVRRQAVADLRLLLSDD